MLGKKRGFNMGRTETFVAGFALTKSGRKTKKKRGSNAYSLISTAPMAQHPEQANMEKRALHDF